MNNEELITKWEMRESLRIETQYGKKESFEVERRQIYELVELARYQGRLDEREASLAFIDAEVKDRLLQTKIDVFLKTREYFWVFFAKGLSMLTNAAITKVKDSFTQEVTIEKVLGDSYGS